MTTWTSSSFWGGFVADCGPYVGPWPPAPPIPANFPAECSSVDYYVSSNSLADVVAGVGYNPDADVFRSSPTVATTLIGTPPVSGNLFVVYFGPGGTTTEPGVDALTIVPPLYAAGGTGAPVGDPATGSYSTPQPFPADQTFTGPVSLVREGKYAGIPLQDDAGGPDQNVVPLEVAAFAALSGVTALTTPATTTVLLRLGTMKGVFSASVGHTWGFGADVEVAQAGDATSSFSMVDLVSTADFTLPGYAAILGDSDFTGLIEGIDYVQPPTGPADIVRYAGGATSSFGGWGDLTVDVEGTGGTFASTTAPPVVTNYTSVNVRFALLTGTPTGFTADGDGTSLGTQAVSTSDSAAANTVTLDLSSAPETGFYVNAQIEDYTSLPAPIQNWSWSGGLQEQAIGWGLAIDTVAADVTLVFPDVTFWKPGPVSDITWHTVGGHFATVGGATLRILTPGVGWVDVVDGPA